MSLSDAVLPLELGVMSCELVQMGRLQQAQNQGTVPNFADSSGIKLDALGVEKFNTREFYPVKNSLLKGYR